MDIMSCIKQGKTGKDMEGYLFLSNPEKNSLICDL